jgi:hypothetical protein
MNSFFFSDGYWTQDLMHAMQVFYHWSAPPAKWIFDVSITVPAKWQDLGVAQFSIVLDIIWISFQYMLLFLP